MSFKYKIQDFQTKAVEAVVDVFTGQPNMSSRFRQDPGRERLDFAEDGFRNYPIQLGASQLLTNLRKVQQLQYGLEPAANVFSDKASDINLDVEMETGTGKTYVYLKTIFELNSKYGWNKFIVMVPSVAIREGVYASVSSTAEHFQQQYGKRIRAFIYNSKDLSKIDGFAQDGGINLVVINTQAFAARGQDARRIHEELDDFHTRRPIDVIKSTNPILILDEPQKMEGKVTMQKLPDFGALAILRYSATHKTVRNLVYRLDALDAYNQRLVKKIAPVGITSKSTAGSQAYVYVERIDVSRGAPTALIEINQLRKGGTAVRKRVRVDHRTDLYSKSGELEHYKDRWTVSDIRAMEGVVEFANGVVAELHQPLGDNSEKNLRTIQIRESVRAHMQREQLLHERGIKVLTLFFIDSVAKYRDYSREDTLGEYARIFEEEYASMKADTLSQLTLKPAYREYLERDEARAVHEGYFSIDKNKRQVDPKTKGKSGSLKYSDDVDAYDLILKDKERLLSLAEPKRFIFSHSALREGWDNPNVFVMCFLKHSGEEMTGRKRQELGRGLRISVRDNGDGHYVRMDDPAEVQDINVLTVVTDEAYKKYVAALQQEYKDAVQGRPQRATKEYFENKVLRHNETRAAVEVSTPMAKLLERYLVQNDYTDVNDQVTASYHAHKDADSLAELPTELREYSESVHQLIQSVYSDAALPGFNKLHPQTIDVNENFKRAEFQTLWRQINRQQVYQVDFESQELIRNAVASINRQLQVTETTFRVETGEQRESHTEADMQGGTNLFSDVKHSDAPIRKVRYETQVRYDLIGQVAERAKLTRATAGAILSQIDATKFSMYSANPEQFIAEVSRLIVEQKATLVVEHLTYDLTNDSYDASIFAAETIPPNPELERLSKHVYDYVKTDSKGEYAFAKQLDAASEVVVYAKLPGRFKIPTPVGEYNPDWAIAFHDGAVKHIYFVAETKGSMSSMQLRAIEDVKVSCARKFFARLREQAGDKEKVKYGVVTDFGGMMDLVG